MALSEYLESPVAVKDLKSNPAPKNQKKSSTDVDEDENQVFLNASLTESKQKKIFKK